MDSIARTKPDISVLRRDILPVSPFGILSQAFTEEILGRFDSGRGMYPMYGLELLYPEGGEAEEASGGSNVHLEVQLKLILQQMKERGRDPAAERILEKVETLRLLREKTVLHRTAGSTGNAPARTPAAAGRTLLSKVLVQRPETVGAYDRYVGKHMAALTGVERMGPIRAKGYSPSFVPAGAHVPGYRQSVRMRTKAPCLSDDTGKKRPDQGTRSNTALARAGFPTVSGLPGQTGKSPANIEFLAPVYAEASTGQSANADVDLRKAPAGLTDQMGRAAEIIAGAMLTAPQNLQKEGSRRSVRREFSASPEKEGSVYPQAGEPAGKEAQDSGPVGNRLEKASGEAATGRKQIGSLPDMKLTTTGAGGTTSMLRTNNRPGADGSPMASPYLPVSMEHTEFAEEYPSVPGQGAPTGNGQIIRAMETAAANAGKRLMADMPGKRHEDAGSDTGQKTGIVPVLPTTGITADDEGQQKSRLTTSGAENFAPMLPVNSNPDAGGNPMASPFLPVSIEHAEPADVPGQIPPTGRGIGRDEVGKRLALEMNAAALRAGRTLERAAKQIAEDSRKQDTLSRLSDGQRNDRYDAQAVSKTAADGLVDRRSFGTERTASGEPTQMERPVPPTRRMVAKKNSGSKGGAAGTYYERSSMTPHAGVELAGAPLLMLEHLRNAQEEYVQDVGQIHMLSSPKVLSRLLELPWPHLLNGRSTVPGGHSAAGRQWFSNINRFGKPYGSRAPMDFPFGVVPSTMDAGGMTCLRAATAEGSPAWDPAQQTPVELLHMEPSLGTATADRTSQALSRREINTQQRAVLRELQRSIAETTFHAGNVLRGRGGQIGAASASASAFGRLRNGTRRFSTAGSMKPLSAVPLESLRRMGKTAFGAVPNASTGGEVVLDWQTAYPELSIEYGGPLMAMGKELRRTVERQYSHLPAAHEMGAYTAAGQSMAEKSAPEPMQTLDLMTQPQLQEQQVVWQNPYMRSAPGELAHHQKNTPQGRRTVQQSQPQARMSDAEIRRTADKVFKLVQEKIITERRRIGRI